MLTVALNTFYCCYCHNIVVIWRTLEWSNVSYSYNINVPNIDHSLVLTGILWINVGEDLARKRMEHLTTALMYIVQYMMRILDCVLMQMSKLLLHHYMDHVTTWYITWSSLNSCQYLHRTAGDTERRYHLRYYKTSTCVYETDSRGFCVKNGPHCAFAHGPHDLRPPVYDVRELQGLTDDDDKGSLVGSLERDKGVLLEDPRWQGNYTC